MNAGQLLPNLLPNEQSSGGDSLHSGCQSSCSETIIYGGTFNEVAGDQITVTYTNDTAGEFENWIAAPNYAHVQNTALEKRVGQTGQWFTQTKEFREWVSLSECCMFLCLGPPGVGKTILSSVAIEFLQSTAEETHSPVAYIYFSYLNKTRGLLDTLRAIAQQLWRSFPASRPPLEALRDKLLRFGSQPTSSQFCEAIRLAITAVPTMYLVLDALDEYVYPSSNPDTAASELLATLLSLGDNVKLLLTSREIGGINGIVAEYPSLVLELQGASEIDIHQYISQRLRAELAFSADGETFNYIVGRVTEAACSSFLMAELHMNSVTRNLTLGEVEDALAGLSQNLHAAYETTMLRIAAQSETRRELAYKVLAWLSAALRPLNLEELRHALACGPGRLDIQKYLHTPSTITSVCAGLVRVEEAQNRVSLIHFTALEFFQLTRSQSLPDPDSIITRSCISYLSLPSLNDQAIITHLPSFLDVPSRLDLVNHLPFFDYAARNWGHHARSCEVHLSDEIFAFLHAKDQGTVAFSYLLLCSMYALDSVNANQGELAGLMSAIIFDLSHSFSRLLCSTSNPNGPTKQNRTPLILAVEMNQNHMVRSLIADRRVDLNTRDAHGRTPLSVAASQDQQDILNLLLSRKKACRAVEASGSTQPRMSQSTLGSRNENAWRSRILSIIPDEGDNKNRTPLSYAAANGNRFVVGRLLKKSEVRINSKDSQGRTPLSYAAERGHTRVVKRLLSHMDNEPDIQDNKGRTALLHAAANGHDDTAKVLLKWANVQVNIQDDIGRTALSHAAATENHTLVRRILQHPQIRPNVRDSSGRTPLTFAVIKGHKEVVNALLEHPSVRDRVSLPDSDGRAALIHAVIGGNRRIFGILLEQRNLKLDFKDANGRTALSYAAQYGRIHIAKALVADRSVDVNQVDREGRTPLSYAAEHGQIEVVRLLIKQKQTKVEMKDASGLTAKHYAGRKGHSAIKRLLRHRGRAWAKNGDAVEDRGVSFDWLKPAYRGTTSSLPR